MKKAILFFFLLAISSALMAQCSDLFFSEYVEGYANNKALEIYNPTAAAVNLSEYSVARYSNGSTTLGSTKIIQLPNEMIDPYDVYVIVIDLTDTTLWDSQLDKPAWNGYNLLDTIYDSVSGLPVTDSLGNVLIGPQYDDNGNAIFGNVYNEKYDLQCKADAFLCPDYDVNNVMYFNGNDAMALVKGTTVAADGSNLVDVIGVIGENPETTIMQDAWVDENGYWLTKDRTLVREPDVAGGRTVISEVVYTAGGTFTGVGWFSYPKNSFQYLGIHNSVCAPEPVTSEYSCFTGPVSTFEVNLIPFNMFPNPNVSGMLNVVAAEKIERLEIFNLMGQRVLTQFDTDATTEINISQLSQGMYLVNLHFAGNQLSVQKLVVE